MDKTETVWRKGGYSVSKCTTGSRVTYRAAYGGMYMCAGGGDTLEAVLSFLAQHGVS